MVQHSPVRPPVLIATRASVTFLLNSVRAITRHVDGDILGGITLIALLQRKLANPDNPDPISVQSLARSLKTPRETMRRCVGRLIGLDLCERMPPYGIVVSGSESARVKIDALLREMRGGFLDMLLDLKQIGFDFDLMNQASEPVDDFAAMAGPEEDIRAVADKADPALDRIVVDFGLRIVDSTSPMLGYDFAVSCVFMAVLSANASPFAFDPTEAWRYGTRDELPPDEARRPVQLMEVSQVLGIPYETARRQVNKLIAGGHCTRDRRKGLLVPSELLLSPALVSASMAVVSRFVQMVAELKRLGFDFHTLGAPA
jgi:hypothetical protein